MKKRSPGLPYISPRATQNLNPVIDPFKYLTPPSPNSPSSLHTSHDGSHRPTKMPSLVAVTAKLKRYSSVKSVSPCRPKNSDFLQSNVKIAQKRIEDAIKVSKISHSEMTDFTFGIKPEES